ncbi:MAG: hypothetical protein MHMPM18_001498 [Marteilia pararefringens]
MTRCHLPLFCAILQLFSSIQSDAHDEENKEAIRELCLNLPFYWQIRVTIYLYCIKDVGIYSECSDQNFGEEEKLSREYEIFVVIKSLLYCHYLDFELEPPNIVNHCFEMLDVAQSFRPDRYHQIIGHRYLANK